jgi:hypothetical protein
MKINNPAASWGVCWFCKVIDYMWDRIPLSLLENDRSKLRGIRRTCE